VKLRSGNGHRILLVEDEVLVGMMMRDLLTELGFFVAGPLCSLADARAAAAAQRFDAAVLDLNLTGESVYPLAELLTAQGVPFVFVTGYDSAAVDSLFSHVPVVQKPIAREHLEATLRASLAASGLKDPAPGATRPAVATRN
jgi:DNA-binding response OmpR family regulator